MVAAPGKDGRAGGGAAAAELEELLARGPFADALAAAVAQRGLTLSRLQDHLARRGASVGVSTLSCWIRGERPPDRPESRQSLTELEAVLGLAPQALTRLLEDTRRARVLQPRFAISRLWNSPTRSLDEVLADLDLSPAHGRIVSQLARVQVDEGGREAHSRITFVYEALRKDVDRAYLIVGDVRPGNPLAPEFQIVSGASAGRRRETSDGRTVLELVLDQTLERGERTVVEYEVTFPPGVPPSTRSSGVCRRPTVLLVHEVHFPPNMLPLRPYAVRRPLGGEERRTPVRLSRAGVLRATHVGQPAGEYGLGWEWPAVEGPQSS
ncbi:MAG: hypothetical protein M3Q27_14145 [Actinomycetota bacterium]|nr:hypothetical protein [Actinomycetota bacterium]